MAEPHFNFTPEELQSEEWRPIPGYEGLYSVSSLGRVRIESSWRITHIGRIMSPCKMGKRRCLYYGVGLRKNGRTISSKIHRLVALAFIGPSDKQINHIDGNKLNNRLANLEYVTPLENTHHSLYVLGDIYNRIGDKNISRRHPETQIRGEQCHTAVLTADDVRAIRSAYATGNYSQAQLARQYGVTRPNIRYIVKRKSWKHID